MELVGECADAHASVGLLHIAVVGADIDNRRYAAAVSCRERALVQGNLLHGLRLEHRKYAQHMVHVIDGDTVQKDKVLIRAAAPHIQAGEALVAALNAGKHLDGLEDIGLTKEDGGGLDVHQGDVYGTKVGRLDAGVLLAHHGSGLQDCRRLEDNVDGSVPLEVYLPGLLLITQITEKEGGLAFGHCKGVVAVHISNGSGTLCLAGFH